MKHVARSRVVCRRVGPERLDEVMAIMAECFDFKGSLRRNIRHLLHSPSARCFAAYMQGRLVGYLMVLFRRNSRVGRVYAVAVLPEYRLQGIGRRLMQRAESAARQWGCERLMLEVRMDNVAAHRMYARLGYEESAVLGGYCHDGAHAFQMQKRFVSRGRHLDSASAFQPEAVA
jgi:ribosomal protein S18 acetylase RimI-like enzyme